MAVRICLLGRLAIEVDDVAVDVGSLGGLGRTALAYLALERRRPVPRDELADVLWGEELPATWGSALRGAVSRLRSALAAAGLPAADVLRSDFGCYQLRLPDDAAVDVEQVASAVERAEQQVVHAPVDARRSARLAAELASHQFLPGATGEWVERRHAELASLHVRALELLAEAESSCGDHAAAVAAAEHAVRLAPLEESAHQGLMSAHARAGNRGAALRAYQRCRNLLVEELGVSPSPETEALYVRLLGDEPAAPEPAAAPAPAPGPRTNLPVPRTSFVGRGEQIEELRRLLGTTRFLALTGPGGVGKSRLAIRVATEVRNAYPDGVWLVELAGLTDPALVPEQLLSVVGAPELAGANPLDALVHHFGTHRVLVVLDNCEHLVSACAALGDALLARCPGLAVLATSREPVGVPGETTWTVPCLPASEAIQLFAERALAAAPDLDLVAVSPDVERVCAQLDGIPLAIELAAARVRTLSVAAIAHRLGDRLRLLVGGARAAPDRHQTLRAAIAWSFGGLAATERDLFVRLSVFAGGFSLDGAERVCDGADVVDALGALVDKSLVSVERSGARLRYRMLETLRQYAAEHLEETGEAGTYRDRHLAWAVGLAEAAEAELEGGDQQRWLELLDDEQDNLRLALDWAAARAGVEDGLRLAGSLVRFWEIRGAFSEGRGRLEVLASRAGAPPHLRAKALNGAAVLAQRQGSYSAARALYQESLVVRRALDDRLGVATALHGLANLAVADGDLVTARSLFEENLGIARELGRDRMAAASLMNLGVVAQYSFMWGRRAVEEAGPEAAACYEQSLQYYRQVGDRYGEALALENLGALARLHPGDVERARALQEQSLAIRRELGDKQGIAASARYIAALALRRGEIHTARQLHEERMAIERELGNTYQVAEASADLAEIAMGEGSLGEAGPLLESARATFAGLGHRGAMARILGLMGDVVRRQGDPCEARRLLEQSLAIARELQNRHGEAWSLVLLGRLARSCGDVDEAVLVAREAIALAEEYEMAGVEAIALDLVAGAAVDRGGFAVAARLAAAADAIRAVNPYGPDMERDSDLAAMRAALGEEAFSAAWGEGLALSPGARRSLARRAPGG